MSAHPSLQRSSAMIAPSKTVRTLAAAAAGLVVALAAGGQARADAGEDLARAKGCFVCHDVTKDTIAPSFRDIGRRFGGLKNAKLMLVPIVHTGTRDPVAYHWGTHDMPPEGARQPVTDEEAEALIDYILSLK